MKHIGIICPAAAGHLNPLTTLGRRFLRRGYAVSLMARPDAQAKTLASGLNFIPVGEARFPVGSFRRTTAALGQLSGNEALRYTVEMLRETAETLLEEGPANIRAAGVEALIVDQMALGGGTIAQAIGLPFVTACGALAVATESDVPPVVSPWGFDPTPARRNRNMAAYVQMARIGRPTVELLNSRRAQWGLAPIGGGQGEDSPLAIVTQQPEFFDFPRRQLPGHFHYTGPFLEEGPGPGLQFPYEKLDHRPLIYASMGTLQNCLNHVFPAIAEACAGLPAQLVISLGGGGQALPAGLPGSPLVTAYAPQRELIGRASLVITHAGLNTTLESLAAGVPMVAIPVTNDQPGVAARIAYIGAGEVVSLDEVRRGQLKEAVARVFTEKPYRLRAREAQQAIARADGLRRAVDIIEEALTTGRPVLRSGLTHGATSSENRP